MDIFSDVKKFAYEIYPERIKTIIVCDCGGIYLLDTSDGKVVLIDRPEWIKLVDSFKRMGQVAQQDKNKPMIQTFYGIEVIDSDDYLQTIQTPRRVIVEKCNGRIISKD